MPDPSEPGRERPVRPDPSTPAPDALRRRVLARVNAKPEPIRPLAAHRARRLLGTPGRRRGGLALSIGALAALALALVLLAGGSSGPRPARPGHGPGSSTASLLRAGNHGELHLAGMPQPPVGEVYEIWLARAGGPPRPTDALFTPTAVGTADVEVPGSLRGIRTITVTAEPRGGSSSPTGPVVLRVDLAPAGAS